jgi:hypothetical protein
MANEIKAEELVQGVSGLAKEIGDLAKEIAELRKQFTETQKVFDKSSTSQDDLAKKTKAVSDADKELEKIKKRQLKITKEVVFAQEKEKQRVKELRDEYKKQQGTLKKSGGLFRSMTKSILAAGAAALSVRAAFNIFKSGIKTIAGFEGAMSKVRAVTGATVGDFKALQANAKLLGSTTAKTSKDVAGLQLSFAKLGFSTKEILAATDATISLSIAAGSDLAESATVAASTIRGFGLSANETQRVVDVMAKSFTTTGLDLEKFKTSMANAQVAANATGKTLEFTAAALGTIVDTGTDASKAGTDLRSIFSKLAIQGVDLNDALDKVEAASNKVAVAQKLVGDRAFSSLITLAENREKTDKLTKSYQSSAGAAKRMADIMEDNLTGETKKLSSAWEGFVLSLNKGEGSITNFLRGVVKTATKFLGLITNTEKESEALSKMRIEMNANLDAIKNQELPLNVRKGLIEKINTQYKDYLPNLIDEKTSLEDIESIQKQANTALLENIRIKAQQELLTEQINKIAELEVKIAKEQIRVEKLKSGEINHTASAYLTQEEQISGLQNTIKNLTGEYEKEVEELNKIQSIFDKLNPAREESVKTTEDSTKAINDNTKALTGNFKTQAEIDKEVEQERLKAFQAAKKKQEELDLQSDKKLIERKKALLEEDEEERKAAIIIALKEEYDIKTAAKEAEEKRKKEIEDKWNEAKIVAAEAAGQILSDQFSGFIDNNLAAFEAGQDAERKILEDKLDKGEISEEDYQKKILALEKKGRIESAKAEKKKAIFDATVAAAVSVIKQLAATPLPAGAPFIAAAAAIGATQIGVAVAQPIPKFKDGEIDIKGARHSQGGISAEIEGGESVINREGTANAKTLLTAINKGLIKDSDILPSASKMFSGADSSELVREHSSTIIGMSELIKKQDKIIKAIANQPQHITNLTDSGLEKAYISKQTKKRLFNEWIKK